MRIRKQCMGFFIGCVMLPGILLAQTTRQVNQNDLMGQYVTINEALADALPGDTVLVHPGIYLESIVVSGIALKALRGPEVTVIQSPDGAGDGITVTGNQTVAIIGFQIRGFERGIVINTDAGSTKVSNCIAAGNSGDGIVLSVTVPLGAKIVNNISADNGGNGLFAIDEGRGQNTFTSLFNNLFFRNGKFGMADSEPYAFSRSFVFGDYNCSFGNTLGSAGHGCSTGQHGIVADPLIDVRNSYRFTNQGSPAVNSGHPTTFYDDPDGSVNDMGAYGGKEAANWWRDPFSGPTIENVTIDPPQVRPGGTVTIRATAKTD